MGNIHIYIIICTSVYTYVYYRGDRGSCFFSMHFGEFCYADPFSRWPDASSSDILPIMPPEKRRLGPRAILSGAAAMSKPFCQQASIITWDLDMALLLWIFWSDHIFGWSFTVHMHLLMVNLCKSPFVLACTRLFVAILCWFNGKASQYAMFGV
jgi:hypothetical protein